MEKKKSRWSLLLLIPLVAATVYILKDQSPYQTDRGLIFGTVYSITYQSEENLKTEIDNELKRFDQSLSAFNDSSTISRINRNESKQTDDLFLKLFKRAQEISKETDGAFDITVAPLVNAWGFGFKKGTPVDSASIDSLRSFISYQKVALQGDQIIKTDERIILNGGAIAKGYACDVIAQLLESKGIKNYLVDIGGEVVVKGENPKHATWRIGVNKPIEDSLSVNQELQTVLQVSDIGMATSGNYRNFYYKDGKKYAHTIDPRTGYPAFNSLLSVTVIASDCMSADAYATAFMVMGMEKAKAFTDARPELDAYFIYTDEEGNMQFYLTKGMSKYIIENVATK